MTRSRREISAWEDAGQGTQDTVWRVAIYIRLSREDGHGESESVQNQRAILNLYVEGEFKGPCEVVDHYIDDGRSGTDDTREAFLRMKRDIEEGRVNCVLCKTLARAFRNYADQGYYLEYFFPLHQVRFISIGDPKIDTFTNPDALTGLEVPIAGLMNDRYASRTSSDIRRTFHMKRERGDFIGAFPPYGFLKDPCDKNRLIHDPAIVPLKQAMKDWVMAEGMSLAGVARKLNDLGIPNPTAYKKKLGWNYTNPKSTKNDGLWTGGTVRGVLLSPANIGHMVQGRQRVISYKIHRKAPVPEEAWYIAENVIEPTFTPDEYGALEDLLGRNTRAAGNSQRIYPLAGFLRCADCGKAMHRRTSREYTYYACRTYTEKSKTACSRHAIPAASVENGVWEAIKAQFYALPSLSALASEAKIQGEEERTPATADAIRGEARQALNEILAVIDGLYWDWKTGIISEEAYQRMSAKLGTKKARLTLALKDLEKTTATGPITAESEKDKLADQVHPNSFNLENAFPLDRKLLSTFVKAVLVHEARRITVQLWAQDELAKAMHIKDL